MDEFDAIDDHFARHARLLTDDAAARLGGSVNDLFVAAAAGGAGAYHRSRGVGVDELRMSMPVSILSISPDK